MTKFEEAMAKLKTGTADTVEMAQIADAFNLLHERVKNLEHFQMESKARLGNIETLANQHTESIASLHKDRVAVVQRVTAIEAKPPEHDKKVEELDKRVTAVEGAVGSAAYKNPLKPGDPPEAGKPDQRWSGGAPAPQPPAPPTA